MAITIKHSGVGQLGSEERQTMGPMVSEIVIRSRNLGKCYQIYQRPQDRLKQLLWRGHRKFYQQFWALQDISFEIKRGETVGVIGRNGSGKSTLLQLIAGTLTPSTGDVEVQGRVAALLELGSGFNPEFTGRENAMLNGIVLGLNRDEMERRFEAIISFAGIGDFVDRPVKTYSSGMVLRLAFSVSINVDPDILIVDEALAVGDAAFQFKCIERLDCLTKSGTTLLFVSHDMSLVKSFCRRVIYLQDGRERASGAPEEMAELYFLDTWEEQKLASSQQPAVKLKPFLGGSDGIAFGTDQGRLIKAEFVKTAGGHAVLTNGDLVAIEVEAEFSEAVRNPHLSVIVYNQSMLMVGGRFFAISAKGKRQENGFFTSRVCCAFKANLGAGHFFITLRLEDRQTDRIFFPIDKQVGVLSFEVLHSARNCILGAVDLGIDFVEREVASK
jgi:lipopolysaccharide transport system ATP-binding protein